MKFRVLKSARLFILPVAVALVSVFSIACGVSQDVHDRVVRERDDALERVRVLCQSLSLATNNVPVDMFVACVGLPVTGIEPPVIAPRGIEPPVIGR